MITPAQQNGIVYGKRYKVTSRRADVHGKIVTLARDDGTRLPYFREVRDDGTEGSGHLVVYVDGNEGDRLEEVKDEVQPTPLKNFIIDVTDAETTVKVGKLLSADQLKRIIEILGE